MWESAKHCPGTRHVGDISCATNVLIIQRDSKLLCVFVQLAVLVGYITPEGFATPLHLDEVTMLNCWMHIPTMCQSRVSLDFAKTSHPEVRNGYA